MNTERPSEETPLAYIVDGMFRIHAERDALAAEVTRLREALERIKAGAIPESVKSEGLFACLAWFETVAALALHPYRSDDSASKALASQDAEEATKA